MSSGDQHRDDTAINREEHAVDGGVDRKRVGLFARDGLGNGVLELSAISTASGAVLSVTPSSGSSSGNLGNVTLNPSPNFIGIVTIANPASSSGQVTIFPGPNQIGSVTVSHPVTADIRSLLSAPTLNVVTQDITVSTGMVTLFPGPNQIGSVTIANTPNVNVSNLLSLASGTEIRSLATILNWPTSLTSLASGTEVRSLATLLNMPALTAGTAQIGSVTISNIPLVDIRSALSLPTLNVVTQAITVNSGMVTIFPGPNHIGLVTVSNTVNTLNTGLISLASGTEIRSLATILNWPTSLTSLASGTEVRSLTTILPRTDYIGLVSVSGNVAVSALPAIPAGANYIGLASVNVANVVNSIATIAPRTDYIGLMSISGNVNVSNVVGSIATIAPRTDYIGLVSVSGNAVVQGDIAHDDADAGNPIKIGGKARTANPTAVAANDRVDAFFDDVGRQVTLNGVPRDLLVTPTVVTITNTTETTVLAAAASTFHDVYGVIITNTSATATEIDFRDTTAGTVRFTLSAPANDSRGITLPFVIPQTTVNTNWTAQAADSVTSLKLTLFAMKNV